VLLWKREVGGHGERRLHRHLVFVTHLSHRALWRLAHRAGYGLSKFKLVHSGAMAARYVGKYVAKPGADLAAWPPRTRWAQTWIKLRRRKTGEWLVKRFPRFTSENVVLAHFDAFVRWLSAPHSLGVATYGEVWSPEEDRAWAPRPPLRRIAARPTRFSF
jgi:hypothetical protein